MAGPLKNPRHEQFAQFCSTGVTPTDAYISAGYSKGGAHQAASRLFRDAKVKARIAEILEHSAQNRIAAVDFSRQRVLNRLSVLSREAQAAGQFSAAARCEELIGKAEGGMFVDRQEQTVWNGDPSKLTAQQQAKLMMELEAVAFKDDPAGYEEWRRRREAVEGKKAEEPKPTEPPVVQ